MHFFYRLSRIHHPPHRLQKMLVFIHLSVCLSACLSVFPPVSLFFFCLYKKTSKYYKEIP